MANLLYPLSEAEYLRVEEAAPEKSEYVAGRMFAMSGATLAHGRLVSNLLFNLFPVVRRAGCEIFSTDVKLRINALGVFYYPDLLVTCEHGKDEGVFVEAPCLVVEVLSPSTETVDRREKLLAYGTIKGLSEYLMVSQKTRSVELNRKNDAGEWTSTKFEGDAVIALSSIGGNECLLSLDSIYEGLHLNKLD